MNATLAAAVTGLGLAVILLAAFIVAIRGRGIRRRRRAGPLRSSAEQLVADFLVGSAAMPSGAGPGERAALLATALEALADLRGSERARLVAFLEQLGFAREAAAELAARKRAARRRAAETLAAVAGPPAVPVLVAGLSDRDVLVRTTCARILAEIADGQTVPLVLATIERDARNAPGAAAAVILALGARQPEALAPLLDPGAPPDLRVLAVTVAGELRLAQYAPALQAALGESDALAASAARGLGLIGESYATRALARLAFDEQRSSAARAAAVTALGSIGDRLVVRLLERLTTTADWPVQAAAASALARLGPPGLAALLRVAQSGPPQVAELAEAAAQS